jgi:hypothetical protein
MMVMPSMSVARHVLPFLIESQFFSAAMLSPIQTDTMLTAFPIFVDPFVSMEGKPHNKVVDQVIRTPGREPSPQPTHVSVPGHNGPHGQNGHRVLRSATVGYIAPPFEGKMAQMAEG